jgi:hypothetical protein
LERENKFKDFNTASYACTFKCFYDICMVWSSQLRLGLHSAKSPKGSHASFRHIWAENFEIYKKEYFYKNGLKDVLKYEII